MTSIFKIGAGGRGIGRKIFLVVLGIWKFKPPQLYLCIKFSIFKWLAVVSLYQSVSKCISSGVDKVVYNLCNTSLEMCPYGFKNITEL